MNTMIIFMVMIGIFFLVGLILFIYILSFKHVFVAKFLTGGKPAMKVYKCREAKDKFAKSKMWFPLGRGLKPFPKPSEDVIIPNFKRKSSWYAEGYVNREGEVIQYVQDNPDMLDSKIKPFSVDQRTITVNQFRKAEAKRHGGFEKYIPMIATFGFLIILVVLVGAFYPKMVEPMNEQLDKSRAFQNSYMERAENISNSLMIASTRLADSCGDTQVVS